MDPIIVPLDILLPPYLDTDSLDETILDTNSLDEYLLDDKSLDEDTLYTNFNYKNNNKNVKKTYLVYDEAEEMSNEINDFNCHLYKNNNNWLSAKTIVSYSLKQHNSKSFFWDYLDILFKNNADDFNNIKKVIYSIDNIILEFNNTIAKYIVDNLKINNFKHSGYIFSNTDNNVWDFKIVVITSKNVYSSNRYIDENTIGCY